MKQIKLLFWLKSRLLLRGYKRSSSNLAGALIMLIFFLPVSIGFGIALGFGLHTLSPFYSQQLMAGALLGVYSFWIIAPMVGYSINDTYDITRLFIYPVPMRSILAGSILGSLLDVTTLLLLPTLLAPIFALPGSIVSHIIVFSALSLFLFHTLSLSQALLLIGSGALRSRRFRDISILFATLFGIVYYVSTRALLPRLAEVDWGTYLHSRPWQLLTFLPPGLAAHAAGSAQSGEYGAAFGWIFLLFLITMITLAVCERILKKVYLGDVSRKPEAPIAPLLPVRQERSPGSLFLRMPPAMQAMIEKESKYLTRHPYYRLLLANMVYIMFALGYGAFESGNIGGAPRIASVCFALFFILLTESQLFCNQFGVDGPAVSTLFLFPADRKQILLGKNIVSLVVFSVINLLIIFTLCALAHLQSYLFAFWFAMQMGVFVVMGLGNYLSIYFPTRLVVKGGRMRLRSGSGQFLYLLLYLAMMLATLLLMIPVIASLIIPSILNVFSDYLIGIPLACAYSIAFYIVSLKLLTPILIEREPDILMKLTAQE